MGLLERRQEEIYCISIFFKAFISADKRHFHFYQLRVTQREI